MTEMNFLSYFFPFPYVPAISNNENALSKMTEGNLIAISISGKEGRISYPSSHSFLQKLVSLAAKVKQQC